MRIAMNENRYFSPDGINIIYLEMGKIYEFPNEIAMILIKYGWAREVNDDRPREKKIKKQRNKK